MIKLSPFAPTPFCAPAINVDGLYFVKAPGDKFLSIYARYKGSCNWVPLHIGLPAVQTLQQVRDADRNISLDSGSYEDAHFYLRSAEGNNMTAAYYVNGDGAAIQAGNASGYAPVDLQPLGGMLFYRGLEVATKDWVQGAGLFAPISHVGSGGNAHALASASTAGFMSAADKTKLTNLTQGITVETDPTVPTHVKVITTTDISNWNAKENTANKSTATGLGTSNTLFPTQNAVKTYVDNSITANNSNYIPVTQKGAVNGVASLGSDGKIPNGQLPSLAITETFVVVSQAAMLALSQAGTGDIAVRTDLNKSFILTNNTPGQLSSWQELLSPTIANTDQVPEGTNNLYFTQGRARAAVSAGSGITYNNTTGVISNASPNLPSNLALGTRTTTTVAVTNSDGTGFTLPIATTTLAGLQSAADKTKLDGLLNYILPIATNTVLGGVKVGSGLDINATTGVLSATNTNMGTVTSVTAGNGMNFSPVTSTGPVTLGIPSAISTSSTNEVTTNSHTHAFEPGGTEEQYISGAGTLTDFPEIPTDTDFVTTNSNQVELDGNKEWIGDHRFYGKLTIPTFGPSTYFELGEGDGASWTTHNTKFYGHYGLGFWNPWPVGAFPSQAVGLINFRDGWMDFKGGFRVNGSRVWHAGNLANGTTAQYIRGDGSLAAFPAIPTVNNGTLTISGSGIATGSQTFSANQAANTTATITVPGTNITSSASGSTVTLTTSTGTGTSFNVGVLSETDPTVPSHVKSITGSDIENWNSSYNINNKRYVLQLVFATAVKGYIKIYLAPPSAYGAMAGTVQLIATGAWSYAPTNGRYVKTFAFMSAPGGSFYTNTSNCQELHGNVNSADGIFISDAVESDANGIFIRVWNKNGVINKYTIELSWLNQIENGYATGINPTLSSFVADASAPATIETSYLKSFLETDPTVPSHVKSITTTNISNWNTAYGWGNHSGLYLRNGSNYTAANTASLNWSGKNEGATGFPETYGTVLSFGNSSYLTQFNGQTGDNNVYFRNSGSHGWGTWQTMASKEWVASVIPAIPTVNNGTLTVAGGSGLSGSGTFTANQESNSSITLTPTYGTTAGTVAQGNDSRFHSAVTIGTANGLSLAGQALSMATASSTTTGALTSANWTTFNSKQSALSGTGVLSFNGTTAAYTAGTANQLLRRNAANTAYEFFTPSYLTSESDPTVPSHVKSITTANISNWDNAFSWGNHANLYVRGGTEDTLTLNNLSTISSFAGSIFNSSGAPLDAGNWWNILSIRHRNGLLDGPNYGFQLGNPMVLSADVGRLFFRNQAGGAWGNWFELATANSVIKNQYAGQQTGATYWIEGAGTSSTSLSINNGYREMKMGYLGATVPAITVGSNYIFAWDDGVGVNFNAPTAYDIQFRINNDYTGSQMAFTKNKNLVVGFPQGTDSGQRLQVNGTGRFSALAGTGIRMVTAESDGTLGFATTPIYTGSTSITLSGSSFQRAALTGDVTAAANSNATTIAANAVTYAKMQQVPSGTLTGRSSAGTGNLESLSVGDGLLISGGTLSTNRIVAAATLDFPALSGTGASASLDITVGGALPGDVVALGLPVNAGNSLLQFKAFVHAPNTVRIMATNFLNSSIDLPEESYRINVFK